MRNAIIKLSMILFLFIACSGSAYGQNVQMKGFVSQGFIKSNKNNYLAESRDGSFQFNEMGLNFSTTPSPKLNINVQIFARDIGAVGNDEMGINYAFAEYQWVEWFGVRAGIVKTPLGFYNDTRDMDMLRTFVFLPSSVYNEYLRDGSARVKGGEIFGNINLNSAGIIQYQAISGGVNVPGDSGTALFYTEVTGQMDSVEKFEVGNIYTGSLTWHMPVDGLKVKGFYALTDFELTGERGALSGWLGSPKVIMDATEAEFQNYSLEYTFGSFVTAIEYFSTTSKVKALDGNRNTITFIPDQTIESNGYYVSVSCLLLDWLEVGAYYSDYENDKNASGPKNEIIDTALAARFDINNNWIAKLEVHKMEGLFGVEPEDDGTIDKNFLFFAAKLTYFF